MMLPPQRPATTGVSEASAAPAGSRHSEQACRRPVRAKEGAAWGATPGHLCLCGLLHAKSVLFFWGPVQKHTSRMAGEPDPRPLPDLSSLCAVRLRPDLSVDELRVLQHGLLAAQLEVIDRLDDLEASGGRGEGGR